MATLVSRRTMNGISTLFICAFREKEWLLAYPDRWMHADAFQSLGIGDKIGSEVSLI